MKITIAGQDYSSCLDAVHPLTIERKWNEPSVCLFWISLPVGSALAMPQRSDAITVVGDDGTIYFTGYVAVTPLPEYAGLATEGPRYRIAIQVLSDEILLDQHLMSRSVGAASSTVGALISNLAVHSGSGALSTANATLNTPLNNFVSEAGANWSAGAGSAAAQARASYRAQSGAISLASIPGTAHTLNETDGTLELASLQLTAALKRSLANDVTVCGEHEPVAYATEYFLGDGVTTQFYLAADPFFAPASRSTLIRELFNEPAINSSTWANNSSSGYFSLGAGGLVLNGGNGIDGQAVLSWIDSIEMGGTLLLEATGVGLSPGSAGILAGFFAGAATQSACLAGFQVTSASGTGATTLQPLIQGAVAGAAYSISAADLYTLRMRIHCPEFERSQSIYRSFGDAGAISFGGQTNTAPSSIQIEVQPFVNNVAGTPVTLYDGAIASAPTNFTLVAASSLNLIGSMRGVNLFNLGTGWVVSTPAGGGPYTRRLGTTAESAECHVERTGKLVFYAGFAPAVGEQVAVSYRTVGRAVGRAVNPNQLLSPVSAWIGTVTSPAARSSADCRNAAAAIVQASAGVSALWSGVYRGTSLSLDSDVWPGDALLLNAPSTSLDAQVVVRTVKVSYRASVPDLVLYQIQFANDWAEDLAIRTSASVPADAWLPAQVGPTYLPNLNNLSVTTLNGSTVAINANVTPPAGGGFEVRRRDFDFMPGEDSTLVMRGALPNFTFARETANDRFYIRMFDGSTPSNYSEFSTALFINLPFGS